MPGVDQQATSSVLRDLVQRSDDLGAKPHLPQVSAVLSGFQRDTNRKPAGPDDPSKPRNGRWQVFQTVRLGNRRTSKSDSYRTSAEGEGFEPSVQGLPAQRFSRSPRSGLDLACASHFT